ncbi:DUF4244 domain-containing protein [Streptomyces sp. CB01881]|uniref:DUF4244 domain-containing protein n=1 Tax=Streptomyces sp. CB01881 TaxID=2078691 RepID=UPI000CDC8F6D|nr:DUF4244 domain-containing protein [Streptomyces sp. CB01881]TYC74403.1 DUF4244 domain-containing protein [Streptomyces sp. CB01881]
MTAVITARLGDRRHGRRLYELCRGRGRWVAGRVRRSVRIKDRSDAGMTTAEYAVGTLGACALAAGLYKVVTSPAMLGALAELLDRALHAT